MLGAIIGDIVGSIYERHSIKTKEFPLFGSYCRFTDDTVMTCAVAEGIMNGGKREDFADAMKKYGRMYPRAGYGGRLKAWMAWCPRQAAAASRSASLRCWAAVRTLCWWMPA